LNDLDVCKPKTIYNSTHKMKKKKKKKKEFIIITPKIIIIIIIKQNTESLSKNNNAIGANFVSKVLFYYLYRFNLVLN
jgi:hypothetical protein